MENHTQYRKKRNSKEKHLVADQPGVLIFILGVFLSVVLGFTLRSFTQSYYLRNLLKEIGKNIGPEWHFNFDSVHIYLSDGFLPAMGIEADNVFLNSNDPCLLSPEFITPKIKAPITLIGLITHRKPIEEIFVEKLVLNLNGIDLKCDNKNIKTSDVENEKSVLKNQVMLVDKTRKSISAQNNALRYLKVGKLEINRDERKYYFRDLELENKSENPKIILLNARFDYGKVFNWQDSNIFSDLLIEYNEFPEKILKVDASGIFREGSFNFHFLGKIDEKKYQYQSDFKNIPVQRLLEIPEIKNKLNINLKSSWMSFSSYGEGYFSKWQDSKFEFENIYINGAYGELSVDKVNFPNGLSKGVGPFVAQLKKIQLEKIIEFQQKYKVPDQVSGLGYLNGQIDYKNKENFDFNGNIKEFGFVFSAKGIRQEEKIEHLDFESSYKKNVFNLKSKNILHGGHNIGNLDIIINTNQNVTKDIAKNVFNDAINDAKVLLTSNLNNVQFSNAVSSIITETSEPMTLDKVKLEMKGDGGKWTLNSNISASKIKFNWADLEQLEIVINTLLNKKITAKIKAKKMDINQSLSDLMAQNELTLLNEYNSVQFNFTSDYKSTDWFLTTANKWTSTGHWNEGLDVFGKVSAPNQIWEIYGTRNEPRLRKK